MPSWGALGWAVGLSVSSAVVDVHVNHTVGVLFAVGYVLGCVGAVVVVRPRGLFGPAITPPLIALLAITIAVLTVSGGNGVLAVVFTIGTRTLAAFPLMAVVTGVTVVVGVVRWLVRRHGR
jgi:hypothetical protein